MSNIRSINAAIKAYFKAHPDLDIIPAKSIMPTLVSKGVYLKDIKKGLPIREELKQLHTDGQLGKLRTVHLVEKGKHKFWYFLREGAQPPTLEVDKMPEKEDSKRVKKKRVNHDEQYIIDLCDSVLKKTAVRQHTFDYLKGDMHRNGRTRSKLPCHAYYSSLKLVLEYVAPEGPAEEYSTPTHKAASGLTRAEQRKAYIERKQEVLPKHGLAFVIVDATAFKLDEKKHISRDEKKDKAVLTKLLAKHIKD